MKQKLILCIIIIAQAITFTAILIMFLNMKQDRARISKNFEQVYTDMPDKKLMLTKQEFKRYEDKMLNFIMDSLKIKYRHVKQTFDNKYTYSYDTTVILTYDYTMPETTFKRFAYQPDSCIHVEGKINWMNDSMVFEIFDITYKSKTIYYWQRVGKRGNKTIWPFGEREDHAVTHNNCTGQTETQQIEMKQK